MPQKLNMLYLKDNGEETNRSRIPCPKEYTSKCDFIKGIVDKLDHEFERELPIGVCHPGVHSPQNGLVKNAPNITWLEKKPFQSDLRKALIEKFFVKMMQIVLLYLKL